MHSFVLSKEKLIRSISQARILPLCAVSQSETMMNRNRIGRVVSCLLTLAFSITHCRGDQPSGKIKNILLIMFDDLKASVLPAYGNTVYKTPNLDRLAASGMVFESANCQGLACAPSRPSMIRTSTPMSLRIQDTLLFSTRREPNSSFECQPPVRSQTKTTIYLYE